MKQRFALVILSALFIAGAHVAAQRGTSPPVPTPTDIRPGSINSEDAPYPYPSAYFPITFHGQELRMSYMDVAPIGPANGHTVVLLHGNNFGGFYFGGPAEALRKEGFPRHRPRSNRLWSVIEADDDPVQLQPMGAQHQAAARQPEDRKGDDRRPLDGRHAGGALCDAVSGDDRTTRDL
jgi:hypothetical protein